MRKLPAQHKNKIDPLKVKAGDFVVRGRTAASTGSWR